MVVKNHDVKNILVELELVLSVTHNELVGVLFLVLNQIEIILKKLMQKLEFLRLNLH